MPTNNSVNYSPVQHDVIVGAANGQITSVSPSTAGFVLTSNGVAADPSFQASSGGSPVITGDSGTITGSAITIFANNASDNSGSTVKFVNSGTVSTLNVTDTTLFNTMIGNLAGNTSITGNHNLGVGFSSMNNLTSGNLNTSIGSRSGISFLTGQANVFIGSDVANGVTSANFNTIIGQAAFVGAFSGTPHDNICIGHTSGNAYSVAESNNILIGNDGVNGESNVLRIGNQGSGTTQQDICYIAGITGASPVSANVPQVVLCDNTGNLTPISSSTAGFVLTSNGAGTPTFQASSGGSPVITGDSGTITGAAITIFANNATNNSGASVKFVNSGTVSTLDVTDAAQNTYIGQSCGHGTGGSNSGLGFGCLSAISSGIHNTGMGQESLQNAAGAVGNTAYGYESLKNLVSGTENIAVGFSAGDQLTGAEVQNIYVGNIGVTGENQTIRIGAMTGGITQNLCYVAGISGASPVNANIPQVTLCDNTGNLTVTPSNSVGFVLTSTGPTTAPTFQAATGAGISTIAGDSGTITGAAVTIFANNATNNAGGSVKFVNSGTVSTLDTTDALNNTFIGKNCGNTTLSGDDNSALGSKCLSALTSGSQNVAVGLVTLQAMSTGTDNTAVGYNSLTSSVADSFNAVCGSNSLNLLNGGSFNCSLGDACFGNLLTGSNNIGLGFVAGTSYASSESSNIAISNRGVVSDNNTIRIGTQGTSAGQQNITYIAGITGASPVNSNVPQVVLCDNTGNLTVTSSLNIGFVLTSTGPASAPTFQPAAGGSTLSITPVTFAMSPYTVLPSDQFLAVDTTGGAVTILMENARTTGSPLIVKDAMGNAAAANITVTTVGGVVLIDGSTSYIINVNYLARQQIFDGTGYEIY